MSKASQELLDEINALKELIKLREQKERLQNEYPGKARPVKSSFEVRGMIDRLDVTGVLLDQQATDELIAFLQMAKTTLPLTSEKNDATSPTVSLPPSQPCA
jgi:hypothetical protein